MMTTLYALGLLLLAQSGPATFGNDALEEQDVAFDALQNGEASAAIVRLETALESNPGDPALLINLGSAYAGIGENERAAEFYRAAIESDQRYRLELADGKWIDSRRAARLALHALESSQLAMN